VARSAHLGGMGRCATRATLLPSNTFTRSATDGKATMKPKHPRLTRCIRKIAVAALLAALTSNALTSTALAARLRQPAAYLTHPATRPPSSASLVPTGSALHHTWTMVEGATSIERSIADPLITSDAIGRFLANVLPARHLAEPTNQSLLSTNIGGGNSATAQAFGSSYGRAQS
jgi:hypothetical protein